MNKLLAPIVAAALAVSAPMAFAGGPVIIEDNLEVIADKPASGVGILPVIIVAVALCAALCGSKDEEEKKGCAAVSC